MDSPAVAERVRALMSRHGIAKRQQTTELCRILDLSFSQGHRKLRGSSPWTLAQIRKVTEAFNEPAAQLLGIGPNDSELGSATAREALLCIGSGEWPCIAWIGNPLNAHQHAEFVAYPQGSQWRVIHAEEAVFLPDACEVLKIEIHPHRAQPRRPVVAIADSDRTAAEALRDYLEQSGFSAIVHDSLSDFEQAMRTPRFDALVTDWIFDDKTAAAAIEAVRRSPKFEVPIFLLTGDLLTGRASELEISDVIRRLDVACYEKPARLAILVADLSKRLGRA